VLPSSNQASACSHHPPLKHLTRSQALAKLDLHHKTLICSVGGCILPDDVANQYIFSKEKYQCSRHKRLGRPALMLDEAMVLLR
jgi:hypothetical protein